MNDCNWLGLGQALDQASLQLDSLGYEQYLAKIACIEDEFLLKGRDEPRVTLEVRRRVAEARVSASILTEQPYSECSRQFSGLLEVGFSDIGQEYTFVTVVARHFHDIGETARALALSEELLEKLNRLVRQAASFIESITPGTEEMRKEMDGSQTEP